jgi:hypothetical protein
LIEREILTVTFQAMTEVMNLRQRIGVLASEAENVRAISEEALEAAQAAVNAESGQIRQRRLIEYERARDSAQRSLADGAMDEAKSDLDAAVKAIADVRKIGAELPASQKALVDGLEEMSKRRVAALEEAQSNLEKAEELAEQARAKN